MKQAGVADQQRGSDGRSRRDPPRHVLCRCLILTSGDDRDHRSRRQRERRQAATRAITETSLCEGDDQDQQWSEPEEFHVL
jgi:hypothetical protein